MRLISDEDAFIDVSEINGPEFIKKIGELIVAKKEIDKKEVLNLFDGYIENKGIEEIVVQERRKILEESMDQMNELVVKTSDVDELEDLAEYINLVILIRFAIDFSFYN
jgi:hypothetical protein